MKKLFLLSISCLLFVSISAQKNTADTLIYSVKITDNWVFYSPQKAYIEVQAKNNGSKAIAETLSLTVSTDKRAFLYSLSQDISIQKNDSGNIRFCFHLPEPGFYRCTVTKQQNGVSKDIKKFNIGYEPTTIVSLPDAQPDLKEFWDKAKAELATVAPDYKLTLLPEQSSDKRKLYKVTMKSLGSAEISGYYCTPVKKGKYPAIITYMGYGSKPWAPKPDNNPDFVEFVLSVRGQALNEPNNIYGDWITFGLDSKDKYYYRGAFMDLIRAIDFVSSRTEVDTKNIFAEGGSQGGAFTLASCALDNRITAAAPTIPFLSDYPDYLQIVSWPANPVRKKQAELGISDKQLFETLSYFDIKNLSGYIQCPVIMSVGLQDEVCPPHTNFAGFNRIKTEKEYHIFPTYGHDVPAEWWKIRMDFFQKHSKR